MPILWEPTSEVDGPPVRGVRVSAQDWADAGVWRHEILRRGLEAGDDARGEACDTEGGAMTNEQMVEWSARLLAVAVFAGVLWLVTR